MGNQYSAIPQNSEENLYTEEQVNLIYKLETNHFIIQHENTFIIYIRFNENYRLKIKSFEFEPTTKYEVMAIAIDYVENKLIPKLREQFTPHDMSV